MAGKRVNSHRALRGVRGRRVKTDKPRNLGGPRVFFLKIAGGGQPIVAGKGVTTGERRRSTAISGRNRAGAEAENIPAGSGASCMDRESEWKAAATGHPDDSGSRRPDGDISDFGTDLRSGLSGL